jgi:hypothetical protein
MCYRLVRCCDYAAAERFAAATLAFIEQAACASVERIAFVLVKPHLHLGKWGTA